MLVRILRGGSKYIIDFMTSAVSSELGQAGVQALPRKIAQDPHEKQPPHLRKSTLILSSDLSSLLALL